jgi:hypothetical protein
VIAISGARSLATARSRAHALTLGARALALDLVRPSENLEKIEKLQRQLRVREAVHRDIQESINRRVHWLAILETGLLLGMSVLSVMFIQKWFNTKGRVGGV